MKKTLYIIGSIIPFMFLAGSLQAAQFNVNLGYGIYGSEEVRVLQVFLYGEGYLSVLPTGNYLSLTKAAVAKLQADYGIINTGYFGLLTRAAVNARLAQAEQSGEGIWVDAVVTVESITTVPNPAAPLLSEAKIIRWNSAAFPKNVGVTINLIRKISDSPKSYLFVKKIADTANDGEETWFVSGERGNDLFIEVVCRSGIQYSGGCEITSVPAKVF